MRKRMTIIATLLTVLAVTLSGCGSDGTGSIFSRTVAPEDYKYNDKDEYKKIIDLIEVQRATYEWGMPIYDWGFGETDKDIYSTTYRKDFSKPVIVIYVNPLADEEQIGMYAEDVLMFDEYYNGISEYKRFCETCDVTYFLALETMGKTIGEIVLDGNNTTESVSEVISSSLDEVRPLYEGIFQTYYEYLSSYEGINYDESKDEYYFILDTKNYSESMDAIVGAIDEINEHNPMSFEQSKKYSSLGGKLGYIEKGFSVYADKYRGEPIIYRSMSEGYLYMPFHCYRKVIGLDGSYNKSNGLELHYSAKDKYNKNPGISLNVSTEKTIADEEVLETVYKFYCDMYERHEEHGVEPWCDFQLVISYPSNTIEGYFTQLNEYFEIREYSYEEFKELFDGKFIEFDPSEYILPDDCY